MFEKKLKALLKSRNMSVTELSKETGVAKTNIQQWLTGSAPNIKQVDKVAQFFNMTIDELFFDRKSKSSLEELFTEISVHTGVYRVEIKKITKKDNNDGSAS